jgi:PAS domain-containing protein
VTFAGHDVEEACMSIEESLGDSEARLHAHIENSPLAVVEFDSDFRVTLWSQEAERLFGWSAGEILGRSILQMRWVHEDDAIYLVALSGYALPEDLQHAEEAGFDQHLAGPPSLEKLEELIGRARV